MKVLLVASFAGSLVRFRGELIKAMIAQGHEVHVACPDVNLNVAITTELNGWGVSVHNVFLRRTGMNPISDLQTLFGLYRLMKRVRPEAVLAYTIKPIIWGGLAARFLPRCQFYALVTGLGFAFQKGSWKKNILMKIVVLLYKVSLKKAEKVIFQNPDNKQVFLDLGIIPEHKVSVINGSGVNIKHFDVKPMPSSVNFLLIARLLGDKGIREYVAAAKQVKQKYPGTKFQLIGPEDPSPDGISLCELAKLNDGNAVEYLGAANDVRPYLENCSIFVLPSYHEGLPRTVLEAMAIGRPILTTDVPGCRETVVNGKNGWLVEKANVKELSERMVWFINNPIEWQGMAVASRALVEDKFDVHKVNNVLTNIMGLSE